MILASEILWLGSPITDWIQSLAALIAVPGAIAAFIFLFMKNKDHEEQIKKLADIAIKIEDQNMIMKEGNSLLEGQVMVLRSVLISQTEATEGAKKLAELEKQKFLLSIRPRLRYNGGKSSINEVSFYIYNVGETAYLKSVQDISGSKELIIKTKFPSSVEKGGEFIISTVVLNPTHTKSQTLIFKIEIKYSDKAGNLYSQEIYGTVDSEYLTTDPILMVIDQ